MAEYIERETAKSVICNAESDFANKVSNNWLRPKFAEAIAKQLDKIPAADVVEVVRCKDCKHRGRAIRLYGAEAPTDIHACMIGTMPLCGGESYCSCGERRNNAAD